MGRAFFDEKWIYWIVATATAAFTMMAYAYQNFETKETSLERVQGVEKRSLERAQDVEKRLDRIENKVDDMLRMMKHSARNE